MKDIDSNVSAINRISGKQHAVCHNLHAQDCFCMLLTDVLLKTVSNKMIGSKKYNLVKNVFKLDQYLSLPVTVQNFVCSWINAFP